MKITDLHMHLVPDVDDGSLNISMSLDMLAVAYEQRVRDIFCTSHNVYSKDEIARYNSQSMKESCGKEYLEDVCCNNSNALIF